MVYLEGDGDAWHPDGVRVSTGPPPLRPLALELAAADRAPALAWLGRPCQLVAPLAAVGCEPSLWSHRRFAEPVIAAVDAGLEALRREAGARELELIGYSGGGVVAALVAARRSDVALLVTVAAPLDLEAWRALHGLGALEAQDPARLTATALERTPQVHLVGERDRVVPPAVLESYAARLPGLRGRVEVVAGRDHTGWRAGWAERIDAVRVSAP